MIRRESLTYLLRLDAPNVDRAGAIADAYLAGEKDGRMSAIPAFPPSRVMDVAATQHIARALRGGARIEAIKVAREAFGFGLKEAKDLIDLFPYYAEGHPNYVRFYP